MKTKNLLVGLAAACLLVTMGGCSAVSGLFGGGDAQRDPDDQITSGGNINAFSLHVGDCLISSDLDSSFSDVPAVPCTEAHDSEVFYLFDMPDGTFDEDAIDDAAGQECPRALNSYVGPNYASVGSEGLDWSYFVPTEDSWANGDREVDCVAYAVSGTNELTSSVKGLGD